MISAPRMGRITQGTIFCGGYAEHYSDLPVWGLVITARCDTVHEKTPIVNYIPVVAIEDWLQSHGGLLAIDREEADVRNRFKSLLSKRELSASLLEVHSPNEIAKLHFSINTTFDSSKVKKEAQEAQDMANWLSQMQQCLRSSLPNRHAIQSTVMSCRKSVEAVVKDLLTYKLSGYYFLPTLGEITENSSKKGYVALLREVHHMPRGEVSQLINGISKDKAILMSSRGLCFNCFDFIYPIAELVSPWTEHLMQSFCNLFGRIGVADIDKNTLRQIVDDIAFK